MSNRAKSSSQKNAQIHPSHGGYSCQLWHLDQFVCNSHTQMYYTIDNLIRSLNCVWSLMWIFCKQSVFACFFSFFHYLLPFPVKKDTYNMDGVRFRSAIWIGAKIDSFRSVTWFRSAIPVPNSNAIPDPTRTPIPIPNHNPNVTVSLMLSQPNAKPSATEK